ncbi:12007_t:CDS:1, partial [Cetraspora pellucida]
KNTLYLMRSFEIDKKEHLNINNSKRKETQTDKNMVQLETENSQNRTC